MNTQTIVPNEYDSIANYCSTGNQLKAGMDLIIQFSQTKRFKAKLVSWDKEFDDNDSCNYGLYHTSHVTAIIEGMFVELQYPFSMTLIKVENS